ncbi:hypothetical protein N7533_003588 [Penicillium manginii]|uniref:uncharacterized protein n=1 Tax=Penicillium manginii TaxID=203109 RepID=UPI0025489F32|nr:uncharacterized protein N7533_003588 [Penicillium manginii]KAJ5761549.1 hypothetical protein N7533_003588 [Penicillium manginii]
MKRKNAVAVRELRKARGSGEASSSRSQRTEEPKGYTGTFEKLTAGVPMSTMEWFASTGKRKKSKGKSADHGKKKAEQKPPPPKKTTYVDMSISGGQLVRSSRKDKTGNGKVQLKNGGGFLGW